jgi:hypothetical protein
MSSEHHVEDLQSVFTESSCRSATYPNLYQQEGMALAITVIEECLLRVRAVRTISLTASFKDMGSAM